MLEALPNMVAAKEFATRDSSTRRSLLRRIRSFMDTVTCLMSLQATRFTWQNRRTAVGAAMVFLALNGAYAQPAKWELYLAMIKVAEKKLTKTDLAAIFREAATT